MKVLALFYLFIFIDFNSFGCHRYHQCGQMIAPDLQLTLTHCNINFIKVHSKKMLFLIGPNFI